MSNTNMLNKQVRTEEWANVFLDLEAEVDEEESEESEGEEGKEVI